MSETVAIRLSVNGVARELTVEPRLLLVDFLRFTLGLTGTHIGCDTSSCGACSVLLGERSVKSCTMFAVQADGQNVTTVEGLASPEGDLHPLQQAFHEEHGLQCGFCTPGMLISAADLLRHNEHPTETEIRRAIAGNICRCTGYQNIVKAIKSVGAGEAKGTRDARPKSDGAPWIGARVKRKEDLRFLTGRGNYVDDRIFPRALHLFPVRSPHAHARIKRIDKREAAAVEGVIAILAAQDLAAEIAPLAAPVPPPYRGIESYPLARGKVRYVGEPVAIVLAESAALAEDAAELVAVEYDVLDPVLDPEAACDESAPRVHDNVPSNLAWHRRFTYGDPDSAFRRADRVIRRRLHIHRFTSAPLETRQAVVDYDAGSGVFHVFSNIGSPERYRPKIAAALKLDPKQFHVECPDIGGGFGMKENTLWVILLCAVARRFGRPAKFVEDRTGHLLANHHSNEVLFDASIAVTTAGEILALRARAIHDEGAYLGREPRGAVNQLRNATSLYRFRDLEMEFLAVITNKCPTGANRSYGKVQQTMLVERMIDEAAREMGLDPVALRRRNLVTPAEMPYQTPTGAIHDGGDYPQVFAKLDNLFDFAAFREEQREARAEGRYLGVGVAAGIEASPANASLQQLIDPTDRAVGDSETALLRVKPDGGVLVALGSVPQGQGHETVVAQIVADELGLTPDTVEVTHGYDSWRDPFVASSGTHASRFATMGVGAVAGAARGLRARLMQMAARLSNAPAEELVLGGGQVVHEASGASFSFAALAQLAPELEERYVYAAPFGPPGADGRGNFSLTYAYGLALVTVEIDGETGRIKPLRIICIDDCGRLLNPMIVEGMIHGAIAHQVGAALFERIRYDAQGQMTTATFKDYLTPTAADLPRYELDHLETPSLFSALGARGAGEGAGTPMVATINAVADALAPFGARLVEGHVTPEEVRAFIRAAPKR